ncbi:DUF1800 family protein [Mycobacterium sp. GA-2829]|uniref:DUF1800 domain-containing protein n=1 Tax=Mycobacterium sp. GA-2829 TaxID=1772283 RepID=UPI000740009D|nr:DUF1800 domain-containing protein [Mycobacterium sp. GA-2829]KUI33486.1 hypothetical protein AU194_29575 [Mycobacterium sp. GA-2829]
MAAARLLRRSGFGTTGVAVDTLVAEGTDSYLESALSGAEDPGATSTPVPNLDISAAKPGNEATTAARRNYNKEIAERRAELMGWWVRRMVAVEQPLREKLTLLWHNHFATSLDKVRYPSFMAAQNETIRSLCLGDFRTLAFAMLTDAAMVRWLDGHTNRMGSPNENLAREFLELFALGHGNGYSEKDVREGARALTGWSIDDAGVTKLVAKRQDTAPKTVLGTTRNLDSAGFCDVVLSHPNSARFVCSRLWRQLASDSAPTSATLKRLLVSYGDDADLRALTRAILTDPEFSERGTTQIVGPVEWFIGLHRAMHIPIDSPRKAKHVNATLKSLGQLPFYPPSVGGWPGGQGWLSAAAAGIRLRAAAALIREGDISAVEDAPASDRLDAAGYLLGIGAWSNTTAEALQPLRKNAHALVAAAANTPEYLVS